MNGEEDEDVMTPFVLLEGRRGGEDPPFPPFPPDLEDEEIAFPIARFERSILEML